jgi:hypothetical protein
VIATLLLLATRAGAAPGADAYFDIGLDYLRKGFYGGARAAFCESLVRAPGQPVPMALLAVAAAAEGRSAGSCAALLRGAYARLPDSTGLRFDLRALLPSARAHELLERDYRRALARARKEERRSILTVLAFLEVQDGDPGSAPSLDRLLADRDGEPYAPALDRLPRRARPQPAPTRPPAGNRSGSPSTKPPTAAGSSVAG